MAKIGFIGLGHMGLPMAINLLTAGHRVLGFDLQASALNNFAQAGGRVAHRLQETAQDQDIVITMLQQGTQVLEAYQGDQGLLHGAKRGTLFIDCSTIDVESARTLHELAKTKNVYSLDAPVSGGVASAAARTLTFMVGGEEKAFMDSVPILSCMGQKVIHTGDPGSGQSAKICNNMILGSTMIAVSEAFNLGKQLGLNNQKLFEVVSHSSGQCWVMDHYVPVAGILDHVPANKGFEPGFAATMMLKDLYLGQDAAKALQVDIPLGEKSTELYQEFIDKGFGDLDFSAIIQFLASNKKSKPTSS